MAFLAVVFVLVIFNFPSEQFFRKSLGVKASASIVLIAVCNSAAFLVHASCHLGNLELDTASVQ